MQEQKFLFILGSARQNGNTEMLARHVAALLPDTTAQEWLLLMDYPLPLFEDIRHSVGVYPQPEGNEKVLFDATLNATDIVIASPLYWYSVSATTKLYLDYWSAWMRVPGADFRARMKGKKLWVISVCSDENMEAMSAHLVGMLRLTADYLDMEWGGVILGYGNRAGDVDLARLGEAERGFFVKV